MEGPGVADGVVIRPERADDHDEIARVVESAFRSAAFGAEAEAGLVNAIRCSENFVPEWSLVAEFDGSAIGHVMVSFVGLRDGDVLHRVPTLSPLAVQPDAQSRGVGSALVRAVVERVDGDGQPFVLLEGSPVFYGRLGFESSTRYGIHITLPTWAPPEAAQLHRLRAYDPSVRGTVEYPSAFEPFAEH